MSVKLIFRCQYCHAQPDPLTQISLEETIRQVVWGQYLDAMPGKWLVWHGRGLYGPPRYACPEHRGDLTAFLREHYGTVGWHPWKRPPYPTSVRNDDQEKAAAVGGMSAMPKWGYGPQVK
jgi:hypothetical protein